MVSLRLQLNELIKAAREYKRCAQNLLNAQTSLTKHAGGTAAHRASAERYDRADAAYELAATKLDRLTSKDQMAR